MLTFKKALKPILVPLMATAVVACTNDQTSLSDTTFFKDKEAGVAVAGLPTVIFQPSARSASKLPFPTDLFAAGTLDGSINIPLVNDSGAALFNYNDTSAPSAAEIKAAGSNAPQVALNTMDGFATSAPLIIRLSTPVNIETLKDGIFIYTPDPDTDDPLNGIIDGVNQSNRTITKFKTKLTYGVDYVASSSDGQTVAILPLRPFAPSVTHYVAVTTGLKTTSGLQYGADREYIIAKSNKDLITKADGSSCDLSNTVDCTNIKLSNLETVKDAITFETLRRQVSAHETAVTDFDGALSKEQISLGFSFTTQNVGSALFVAKTLSATEIGAALAGAQDVLVVDAVGAAGAIPSPGADGKLAAPFGSDATATNADALANLYTGVLKNVQHFLDPEDLGNSFWVGDPADYGNPQIPNGAGGMMDALTAIQKGLCAQTMAAKKGVGSENLVGCNAFKPKAIAKKDIPVLISVPKLVAPNPMAATCSAANAGPGLPVVIFQHGITRNRGDLLALADGYAQGCFVGIAIDMAKHGITAANALSPLLRKDGLERLVSSSECDNPATTAVETEDSGCLFINLANLPNSRDGLRQSVVDLHALKTAIKAGAISTAEIGGAKINTGDIHFEGISLGGIVGMPFVAQDSDIKEVVLSVTGGQISKIIDGSPSFEPRVAAGLAAIGVTKPSADYESFMIATQTLVDNTDPINFAAPSQATSAVTRGSIKFPSNAAGAPQAARGILMHEVVGGSQACSTDTYGTSGLVTTDVDNSGCPDQVVPNNVFGTAFATAYAGVIGKTQANIVPQTGFLAGQNTLTVPSALSGTDPVAQGTDFVQIALSAAAGQAPTPGLGYTGLGLTQVGRSDEGAVTAAIVRFNAGEHGSLLSPASNANVTFAMQVQANQFMAGNGVLGGATMNGALGAINANFNNGVIVDLAAP